MVKIDKVTALELAYINVMTGIEKVDEMLKNAKPGTDDYDQLIEFKTDFQEIIEALEEFKKKGWKRIIKKGKALKTIVFKISKLKRKHKDIWKKIEGMYG